MTSLFGWIQDFLTSILSSLGLVGKQGTILLLGLDNAGKTTLLQRLRQPSYVPGIQPPTERPNLESFRVSGVNFVGWDLGGHEAVRHLWDDYAPEGNAILFLIDASDPRRFEESAEELDSLVNDGVVDANVPIAILLNKCDLETAAETDVVEKAIGYEELLMKYSENRIEIFRISVLRGDGYQEAFQWLSSFL
uniref:Uncharacterized protein n=1 Tax=Proboscia inermis TaxID=420281 RepID=A0A7S0BV29_9STRA|mmetsp:Transcript_11176/g.11278  ORF Transcript_11176/g.11278 Transcript_11176/m.11278 type:complete len:193 (+) Transcript_11176:78-656(+)